MIDHPDEVVCIVYSTPGQHDNWKKHAQLIVTIKHQTNILIRYGCVYMFGSSGVLLVQHTCLRDVRFYIFPNNKTYTTSNVRTLHARDGRFFLQPVQAQYGLLVCCF